MTEQMQAIRIHELGDANVLKYETVLRPTPHGDEVLIRVHGAGVNPVDYKTRSGSGTSISQDELPWIPGWDVAGIVEQAPDNSLFAKGDAVYGMVNFPKTGSAYAEYVIAKPGHIASAPQSIDLTTAASVPLVTLTAWQGLFEKGNLQAGQTILIHAAAGGVGHIAVQLAKWRGATVIGTASGKNADYLAEIGVNTFIDYTQTRFEDVVRDVDMVFDAVGGETLKRSIDVVKPGGTLITIAGQPDEAKSATRGITATRMLVHTSGEQLVQIAKLIDDGILKPTVENTIPLSQAADAHRLLEDRHVRGKIVLVP